MAPRAPPKAIRSNRRPSRQKGRYLPQGARGVNYPTNTGRPLAYMGVHGTADGICPLKSGRASKERFVKNNGCTAASTVPEATSSTHVVYDHECPTNYPVKWATRNGGHTDQPKDPGQSTSWDIDMTWKFITQF